MDKFKMFKRNVRSFYLITKEKAVLKFISIFQPNWEDRTKAKLQMKINEKVLKQRI